MSNTAICYFSGTGNSLDISLKLNIILKGDIFYIPNTDTSALESYEKIIIVSPIFCFGLPIPTKEFIGRFKEMNDKLYSVVLHYGGFSGNAAHFTKMVFKNIGLNIENIYKLKMPESFTIFMTVPNFHIKKLLTKSLSKIEKIAHSIKKNETKAIHKNIFSFCDNIHQKTAQKWATFSDSFIVTESCTKCGYCEKICPSKNIVTTDGVPTFSSQCVACLACYHRCPTKAINYGKKTIGIKRYYNPNVDFENMK